jgi:subtilisin family serine protease
MRLSIVRKGFVLSMAAAFAAFLGVGRTVVDPAAAQRKLDPTLIRASQQPGRACSVLLKLRENAPTPAVAGVSFRSRFGDILTADLRTESLRPLAMHPDVERVERASTLTPCADVSTSSSIAVRGDASGGADSYDYAGTAGETVTVTALSEGTDTTLTVDAIPDGANSGPGTDDQVTTTFATSGVKVIVVGGGGPYTLLIRSSLDISPGLLTLGDITATNTPFHVGTRASLARTLNGVDGTGVVIGFVDSGIDFANLDFRFNAAPNNTRLISIWDQTLARETDEFTPPGFAYGVEYTELQINNHLNGSLPGYVRSVDTGGHGTTVAGVAAGDGSNGAYIGAAPGARLIMVKSPLSTSTVLDGINYIRQTAQGLGLPCVINLSLGTHDGPHDGTSLFDKAIDLVGGPGVALVVAGGNNGDAANIIHDRRTYPIFTSGAFTYDPLDTATSNPNLATHIVISEIQVAPLASQFVELYNPTDTPIVIAAWQLQFKIESGGGYSAFGIMPAGAAIPPFGYYLVGVSGLIPAPDLVTAGMGAAAFSGGNIRLVKEDTTTVIDKVGYGTFADDAEGSAIGAGFGSGNSLERLPGGALLTGNGTDTDVNSADFVSRPVPQPQNSTFREVPGKPHVLDLWADDTDQYAVTVTDGTAAGTVSAADNTTQVVKPTLPNREMIVENRIDTPSNGATHIRITLAHEGPLAGVSYTVTLTRVGGTGSGVVDAYAANELGRFTATSIALNADGTVPGTIAEPGTSFSAITVGAYVSKYRWDNAVPGTTAKAEGIGTIPVVLNPRMGYVALFSSRGPTRDGRTKPDIAAPGTWIGAARAAGFIPPGGNTEIDADTDYVYQQGTSFSAPQVAGVIALLFSKNSAQDHGTVKFQLGQTAVRDLQTNIAGAGGDAWGAGKLNAVALLAQIGPSIARKAHNAHCPVSASRDAGRGTFALLVLAALAAASFTLIPSRSRS